MSDTNKTFQALSDHVLNLLRAHMPDIDGELSSLAVCIRWENGDMLCPRMRLLWQSKSELNRLLEKGCDLQDAKWDPDLWDDQEGSGILLGNEDEHVSQVVALKDAIEQEHGVVAEHELPMETFFCQACSNAIESMRNEPRFESVLNEVPVFFHSEEITNEELLYGLAENANPNEEAADYLKWIVRHLPDSLQIDESKLVDVAQLACYGEHLNSLELYKDWARERWTRFETEGPLALTPIRVGYVEDEWVGAARRFFAILFPASAFSDIEEFSLFDSFSSSVTQDVIEQECSGSDSGDLLKFFYPPEFEEACSNRIEHFDQRKFLVGNDLNLMLKSWPIPQSLHWVSELTFVEGEAYVERTGCNVTAQCNEGFLLFFVVD